MKLSSIDLGFFYTKSIVNGKPSMIKSVIGNSKSLMLESLSLSTDQSKDHIVVKRGSEEFFVSDLAIDQSDSVVHSLKAKRFDSNVTQVLIDTAFGMGFGTGYNMTYVVSGLPVSHYALFKDEIKNLFMGTDIHHKPHEYNLKISGKTVTGSTTVWDGRFIPQPFGVLVNEVLDNRGDIGNKMLAARTVAVIDIGFGTSDVFVANALSPIEKLTFSTQTAMNQAYRMISNKIQETFDVLLPLYEIEKVVRKKEFSKSGKVFSMEPIINWAFQSTAEQLVAEVLNKWKTLHEIDHVILAGGGSAHLSPYILPEFENSFVSPDGQWAVVKGYEKWGKRTWKDSF